LHTAPQDACDEGIELHVVKPPEAKGGFALLPRRRVVERRFGWLNRLRRLARDYERPPIDHITSSAAAGTNVMA